MLYSWSHANAYYSENLLFSRLNTTCSQLIYNTFYGCTQYFLSVHSDEERRFMYKINQGHLTVFCIVFVWLGGPPSPVRIITQVPWLMYQNRLGPSDRIYYPKFVPCFVVLYLNSMTSVVEYFFWVIQNNDELNFLMEKSNLHRTASTGP